MLMELNTEQLSALAQLAIDKKLEIKVGSIYQLSEAQQAHQDLEQGSVCGKRVFELRNC